MKTNHTIGKKVIANALKNAGLSAKRVTNANGERVWKLSDGREFKTMAEIADFVK